ncbi:antibiotic biosynthesis monooxygenase family protein [Amycolatopsis sp., V23-08]|uniref:Antibiotic biosynthesis monooxygenase family protein n=1 Tax=Amycolatopsis heterodermiae TaxID=3110235 RepID=A0ABU5RM81_9PSEU|nr:antibiotic biosynthesis monooxygenase family protein [Amycolatopsis sp., V23-08]MEA5367410.1 antibiotic biosynthesis monooxygenase family protein [Amycolatopsis sp., V23-08]
MSSNDAVVNVVTLVVEEGHEDEVERAFRVAVRAVHGEPGCERYALHRDPRSPSTFVLIEKWVSAEAFREHEKAPALAALTAAIGGLFAAPPIIQTVSPLPEGDEHLGQL